MYYKSRGYSLEFKEVYAAMNDVLQIISKAVSAARVGAWVGPVDIYSGLFSNLRYFELRDFCQVCSLPEIVASMRRVLHKYLPPGSLGFILNLVPPLNDCDRNPGFTILTSVVFLCSVTLLSSAKSCSNFPALMAWTLMPTLPPRCAVLRPVLRR